MAILPFVHLRLPTSALVFGSFSPVAQSNLKQPIVGRDPIKFFLIPGVPSRPVSNATDAAGDTGFRWAGGFAFPAVGTEG